MTLSQPYNQTLFLLGFGKFPDQWKQLGVNGHPGIDLQCGHQDPIYSFSDGDVIYVDEKQGTCVIIDENFEYSYAHLDSICVNLGDKVKEGDEIGTQGNKGMTMLADELTHLHFGLRTIDRSKIFQTLRWNFPAFSPIKYHILDVDNGFEGYIDPCQLFDKVVKTIAKAIERKENCNKSWNNPGAIRGTDGNFLTFPTYEEGFNYLCNYLERAATGQHKAYNPNCSVYEFFKIYSPSSDGNDPLKYAKDIISWTGLKSINDPIKDWLLNDIDLVKKYNGSDYGVLWTDNSVFGIIKRKINLLWSILN